MIIYIAEQGCYSDRYFAGAFDSLERAIAAFDPKNECTWTYTRFEHGGEVSEDWHNGKDWGEAVRIQKDTLITEGPLIAGNIVERTR